MDRTATTSDSWWGELQLAPGDTRRWRIGPLTLWLTRLAHELQVAHASDDDPLEGQLEAAVPCAPEEVPDDASRMRFAFSGRGGRLRLQPLLAERAVVVHPESPLLLPPGENATLFVSSPVWLALQFGAPPRTLLELPSLRPSDTWFGPDTRVGELCYAMKTAGRLSLDELPLRPHRAITPVRIRNRAPDALLLERLKVPLPYLSLYRRGGRLWTNHLTLVREQDGDLAALQLGRGAPEEAGTLAPEKSPEPRPETGPAAGPEADRAERLAPPREAAGSSMVLRAFSRLFRGD